MLVWVWARRERVIRAWGATHEENKNEREYARDGERLMGRAPTRDAEYTCAPP